MEEITNDLPPVWGGEEDPAVGEVIEGFYTQSRALKVGRGKPFLTHVLQDEHTGALISFSGAIADRKILRAPKGTFVRVEYLGKLRTNGGFESKNYKITYEKGARLLAETDAIAVGKSLLEEFSAMTNRD